MVFTLAAAAVGQTKLTLGQVNAPVMALDPDNISELDRGVVNLVDNQVDQSTGTIKLKATFPNLALKLWPGNFANGRITVDIRRGAITVDAIAVRHGPRGDFVWVAKPDQTAAFRPVVVGQVFGGRAMINRGLAKGEEVVIEGYYRLENGSRIEIDRATPKPAAPSAQSRDLGTRLASDVRALHPAADCHHAADRRHHAARHCSAIARCRSRRCRASTFPPSRW